MGPAPTKVELKSLSITPGEQCVIVAGMQLKQWSYVVNWDCPTAMHNLFQVLCLDQVWGRYGLMVYAVLDQKTIWQNAVTMVGELMTVAIGKTLVSFV